MKSIEIFVDGVYDYKFQLGTWVYYMSYKKAVIKRTGQIHEQGSYTRETLQALYKALEKIKEPCNIKVYSKVSLGFKTPKKSQNKDLLVKVLIAVNKAGHIVRFDIDKEFSKPQMWEQIYGTPINNDNSEIKSENTSEDKTISAENIVSAENKTAKPDINNKKTPNDVFSARESEEEALKREWEEILNEQHGVWVPGSGGY